MFRTVLGHHLLRPFLTDRQLHWVRLLHWHLLLHLVPDYPMDPRYPVGHLHHLGLGRRWHRVVHSDLRFLEGHLDR